MFDDTLEKDPKQLTFEETYENLNLLNRKMIKKLKEKGLNQNFEIVKSSQYYSKHSPNRFRSRDRIESF